MTPTHPSDPPPPPCVPEGLGRGAGDDGADDVLRGLSALQLQDGRLGQRLRRPRRVELRVAGQGPRIVREGGREQAGGGGGVGWGDQTAGGGGWGPGQGVL